MTAFQTHGLVVVADTTPLNYLVQLEVIELLNDLFGRILVPQAVIEELTHIRSRPLVRAWATAPPVWLEVFSSVTLDPSLAKSLGTGEREAISLAAELNADLVLIDDIAGRKAALARNLPVAGTLAILLQASLRREIDLAALLQRLRILGFRMTDDLEETLLARYKSERIQQTDTQ